MLNSHLKFEEVVRRGENALKAGNFEYAVAVSRYLFRYYPRVLEGTRLLAKAYTYQGRLFEADKLLAFGLGADPHDYRLYLNRARLAVKQQDFDQAVSDYERAFELEPQDERVRDGLLELYNKGYGSGEATSKLSLAGFSKANLSPQIFAETIAEYEQLAEQKPERLDIKVWLLEAYWRGNDFSRAEELAYRLLETHPYLIKANLILWHLFTLRRQVDTALSYLATAQLLDPLDRVGRQLFANSSFEGAATACFAESVEPEVPNYDQLKLLKESATEKTIPLWLVVEPGKVLAIAKPKLERVTFITKLIPLVPTPTQIVALETVPAATPKFVALEKVRQKKKIRLAPLLAAGLLIANLALAFYLLVGQQSLSKDMQTLRSERDQIAQDRDAQATSAAKAFNQLDIMAQAGPTYTPQPYGDVVTFPAPPPGAKTAVPWQNFQANTGEGGLGQLSPQSQTDEVHDVIRNPGFTGSWVAAAIDGDLANYMSQMENAPKGWPVKGPITSPFGPRSAIFVQIKKSNSRVINYSVVDTTTTVTVSLTLDSTVTVSVTPTPTASPTSTPSPSPSPSPTPTCGPKPTPTPSLTLTPTPDPSLTTTPEVTVTPSPTPNDCATPTLTPTATPTCPAPPRIFKPIQPTFPPGYKETLVSCTTPTPTVTPTFSPSPSPSATPSPTATEAPLPSATPTLVPTATPVPSATPRPTATATTLAFTPTPSPSATPTPSATPSPSPSPSPSPTTSAVTPPLAQTTLATSPASGVSPIPARLLQGSGIAVKPGWEFHTGIDIGVGEGTQVQATADGVIEYAGDSGGGYGRVVFIKHAGGFTTVYAHNSRILVVPGQFVTAGTIIALSGNTGYSTGPHVHYEVRYQNQVINPAPFMR